MTSFVRKYVVLVPAVLLLFGVTACDSNDEPGLTETELFVGDWALTGVSDANGNVELTNFTTVVIGFTANSASITASPADNTPDVVFSGTYAVNEASDTITINLTVPGVGTIPVAATYEFSGDNAVKLTIGAATAALLGPLFGTQFTGAVELSVTRVP